MDTSEHLVAKGGLIWSRLTDEDKATLRAVATWPPDFIIPEALRDKVRAIIDGSGWQRKGGGFE